MQIDSRQLRQIGTYLLLAAGAVLGIVIGILFAVSNRPGGPPPTATIPAQVAVATPTGGPLWHVTFTTPVAGGPWSEGTHDYDLQLSCQDGTHGFWEGIFIASGEIERANERVYLRTSGLMSAETGGSRVQAIAPSQPLGASLTLAYPTLAGADGARIGCQATVQVDRLAPQRLEPRIPVQR